MKTPFAMLQGFIISYKLFLSLVVTFDWSIWCLDSMAGLASYESVFLRRYILGCVLVCWERRRVSIAKRQVIILTKKVCPGGLGLIKNWACRMLYYICHIYETCRSKDERGYLKVIIIGESCNYSARCILLRSTTNK